MRAISEGLRQEAGDKLRVTIISPGFVHTNLADSMTNPENRSQIPGRMEKIAISPDAIARAIAFAIEQPADVDVKEKLSVPLRRVNSASLKQCSSLSSHQAIIGGISPM